MHASAESLPGLDESDSSGLEAPSNSDEMSSESSEHELESDTESSSSSDSESSDSGEESSEDETKVSENKIRAGRRDVESRSLNHDPAIAGSVVVTTVTDVVGFLSFLGLATIFLI